MDRLGIITQLTEPHPFGDVINLAHPRLGAQAIFATDEFYGDKARLISPEPPVFLPDKYDANGKWMDGWESRRRRTPGHDWCVIRLGMPGRIAGIEIDTRHFTGNYPPHASVDACYFEGEMPDDSVTWHEIVAKRKVERLEKERQLEEDKQKNQGSLANVIFGKGPRGGRSLGEQVTRDVGRSIMRRIVRTGVNAVLRGFGIRGR